MKGVHGNHFLRKAGLLARASQYDDDKNWDDIETIYNFFKDIFKFVASCVLGPGHSVGIDIMKTYGFEEIEYICSHNSLGYPRSGGFECNRVPSNVHSEIEMMDICTLTPEEEANARSAFDKLCKALKIKTIGSVGYKLITSSDAG